MANKLRDEHGLFIQVLDNETSYSVVVEDDNKVAYAFLLEERQILTDVWLYNCLDAPTDVPWTLYNPPFLNPIGYVRQNDMFSPIQGSAEVRCEYERPQKGVCVAKIFIRDELHAILDTRWSPGCCRLALKDGPLAKVLR